MPARPLVDAARAAGKGACLRPEIAAQLSVLSRDRLLRLTLTMVAYGLSTMFLPVWIAALAAAVNLGAEVVSMRLMRDLDPGTQAPRYRIVILCHLVMEIAYAGCAGLIWQLDAPFATSFAVGMIMTTLLHLGTVRAIHLPFGLTGLTGVGVASLIGNAARWVPQGDWTGLALSTLCALGVLTYAVSAMIATNRLYREAARGREAAQTGYEDKNRFLAQMSHELRTPLNAILGMGHAELRRNRDELSKERLSVLISSAEGLSTILDDVLDMAAVQEGRLPIRPRRAVPHDEVRTLAALFRPGIEAAGLALHTDLDPSLDAAAMFDTQRLRQCLSNLLSNAMKNTTAGTIGIAARVDVRPDGGAQLRIAVRDTGTGIPRSMRRSIFEPFRHVRGVGQGRTVAMPGGNGLGLSISQGLARQMGGDLVLGEMPEGGQGAEFVLTVRLDPVAPAETDAGRRPVDRAPVASQEDAGQGVEAPHGPAEGLAGLRVLVVDDIATNRLVAVTYLRMLGAQPMVAPGGDAALSRLRTEAIDLVLLDMNMPDMDGVETLRRIRALPGPRGRVPVIAMTADAGGAERERYGRSGLDGYLAKPFNPERIEAEIRTALARPSPSRAHRSDASRTVDGGAGDGRMAEDRDPAPVEDASPVETRVGE